MISLYEVTVPLDDGSYIAVLMASPDAKTAISEVARRLRASASPLTNGHALTYHWCQPDMTAKRVQVAETLPWE